MTGPEHYREAERLISEMPAGLPHEDIAMLHHAAQVHATLANAAAAALPTVTRYMGDSPLITEWGQATGWTPAEEGGQQA